MASSASSKSPSSRISRTSMDPTLLIGIDQADVFHCALLTRKIRSGTVLNDRTSGSDFDTAALPSGWSIHLPGSEVKSLSGLHSAQTAQATVILFDAFAAFARRRSPTRDRVEHQGPRSALPWES